MKVRDIVIPNPNNSPDSNWEFINYLDTGNCTKNEISLIQRINKGDYPSRAKRVIKQNDVIISTVRPNQCHYAIIKAPVDNMVVSTGFTVLTAKEDVIPEYLYYFLTQNEITERLNTIAAGATTSYPSINPEDILDLDIEFPEKNVQEKIAKILTDLDDKISLNNRINAELEQMAKTIYNYWFVQFDFPTSAAQAATAGKPELEGKPYKTSGGEMVWNEELKREVPVGWEVGKLGNIIEIHDSKRIPLSNQQREKKKGIYPYYGATEIMDHIDEYIFDGTFILMAEDGSVMDKNGNPVLQYIWGKTWVNNHAHVLEGKNGVSNEYLHLMLKNISVIKIMSGSIQKKINQENLKNAPTAIVPKEILSIFDELILPIYTKYKLIFEENQELIHLRDFLLPLLMNGQVRVDT